MLEPKPNVGAAVEALSVPKLPNAGGFVDCCGAPKPNDGGLKVNLSLVGLS